MKRCAGKKEAVAFVISVLLIAIVFMTGILNKQKVWDSVPVIYKDGKTSWSLEAGDEYGFVSEGPGFALPAGQYQLKWRLNGDGDNRIHLICTNDVGITPDVISTTAGEWEDLAAFELEDTVHNFTIRAEFASGTWMEIYNFRLYSPVYTDHAWTFAFAVLLAWIGYWAWRLGLFSDECRWRIALIAAAVLLVSGKCMTENNIISNDLDYHIHRFLNLADGMRSGQLPVRVGGYAYNGYGAAMSVFYPDFLLYPGALMILGGASVNYVINVYYIALSVLSAVTCYAASKRIFDDQTAGVCASLLYVCAVYRLRNMYVRAALGEVMAMAVLPLFILGLWEVCFGEKKRWPLLVFGATLVFQSHLLSAAMCGVFAVGLALFSAPVLIREKRVMPVILACTVTLLINIGTLIPLATTYLSGVTTMPRQWGFLQSALSVPEVFGFNGRVGVSLWLGAVALLCVGRDIMEPTSRRYAYGTTLLGAAIVMMSTEVFPWSYAIALTGGLVEVLQFTQRLLLLGTVFMALGGGYGFAKLVPNHAMTAGIITLVVALVSAGGYLEKTDREDVFEYGCVAPVYMSYPQYQFEGTDLNQTRSRQPILAGDVELTQYEKDGTRIEAQVTAQEGGEITFPLFGFDGYAAELNGERVYWWRGENNCLTVDVPAGTQGELHVWFEGIALWRVADVISLLSAMGLLAFALLRHKSEFRPRNRK